MRIRIPNNWTPRGYQRPAWDYLEKGGRHAELIWHRRSGKDEISMHRTAVAAMERPATYWHMLPQASQARKAIWNAINPHTGKRRIDEAFPPEIRSNVNDNEMFIRFKNGSNWQVVGSDNYNSLVGSPPAGVVYSEWALANPACRAYLRPIMMENKGWQIFITTPRGKNHAYNTYIAGKKTDGVFAQILTVDNTGLFDYEQIDQERQAYIDDFGEDQGNALFEQEWYCSFEAAILGAYYAKELAAARNEGRIGNFPVDPNFPVQTAWDIGRTDDTSIWFYQSTFDGIRVVDFHSSSLKDIDFYVDLLRKKPYQIEWLILPHDAKAKRLGMKRTVEEQLRFEEFKVRTLPALSVQDGIQSARKTFQRCHFHEDTTEEGLNALSQYRREWDSDKKCFKNNPVHDWTSHPADAFRYLSMAWMEAKPKKDDKKPLKGHKQMTLEELWKLNSQGKQRQRI